jgi:hypothetical protein
LTNGGQYYAYVSAIDGSVSLAASRADAVAGTNLIALNGMLAGSGVHHLHAIGHIDLATQFVTGEKVVYQAHGGNVIGGLANGGEYYVRVGTGGMLELAATQADAFAGTNLIVLDTSVASGTGHELQSAGLKLDSQPFVSGQKVRYEAGSGSALGGLTDGGEYYVHVGVGNVISFAATRADALSGANLITVDADSASGMAHHLQAIGEISIANTFVTGQKLVYDTNGGSAIGGLTDGGVYYANISEGTLKLAATRADAMAGTNLIALDASTASGTHELRAAGLKLEGHSFVSGQKVTYSSGGGAAIGGPHRRRRLLRLRRGGRHGVVRGDAG